MPMTVILQTQAWDNLTMQLNELLTGAAQGTLNLLLAVLVALVGWGVAALVAGGARALLRAVRFNEGVRGLVGGGVLRHEPAGLASWAVYWTIIVMSLMLALDTLGFGLSSSVTMRLGDVLPRIVASGALLAIGVLVAMLIGALTRRFFETAGLRGGRLRGQVVTAVLTGFAVLVALEQLGFAAQFVMAIGLVALGSMGLALGLAFGLGCRDLARDFVVEYLRSLDERGGPQRPA
jgi:hypothetical protein